MMFGEKTTLFLTFTISVLLLFWKVTSANAVEVTAISKGAENRAVAATVRIYTKEYSWQSWQHTMFSGSGFFVSPNHIATNFHVITDKSNSRVMPYIAYRHSTQDRFRAVEPAKIFDIKRDLAVLRVSRSRIKQLLLGCSETAERLDRVYVVGFAKALNCGITSGEINNPKERLAGVEYIRFDAAVSPGNSGGPVLDLHGDVIGVATAVYKSRIKVEPEDIGVSVPQNLNFAVPSNNLRSLLDDHGVRILPKPKRNSVDRDTGRKIVERAKAETAKAEAKKAEAVAKAERAKADQVKAEARKVEAEARKTEAEAKKAEAEARKTEAEAKVVESEKPKEEKAKSLESKSGINDQLQAATVHIYGTDRNGKEGRLGTGFFVREDQVATDFHVVDGSTLKGVKPIKQGTHSANAFLTARLLKTKKAHQLAILQVGSAGAQPLSIGNSDNVQKNQEIRAFTNPSAPNGEFSIGKISPIPNINGLRLFEFEAPVKPGSSGGPIVNSNNEVIAVAALKVSDFSGSLKFAIPSNYLKQLIDGKGDQITQPDKSDDPAELPHAPREPMPRSPYHPARLLNRGIELYEKTRFEEAIEHLESALNGLVEPKIRAKAHLYLGFAKWGLAETESSVNADFREALRYNPAVELPPRIGQNHPVFSPLFESARHESIGTLSISVLPPETEIWIFGGEMKRRLLGVGSTTIRLFKGSYAVEGILDGAHKVVPVVIKPNDRQEISLAMPPDAPTSHEFELTLDLFSAQKPKEVVVHFTVYDAGGERLDGEKKEMKLREQKTETSTWVYHVKLPSAPQGGNVVYRIEADGKIIRDDPMHVEILEPPENVLVAINQTVPIKARVISNADLREVRVFYDSPGALTDSSPSKPLGKVESSDTYNGAIPAERNHSDGDTWYYISATTKEGIKARSATRAIRVKPPQPVTLKITLEPVPDPLPINKPINITAEVKSGSPLLEVRVHYDFPRTQLSETSPSTMLKMKSSDTYIGKIPKERTREEGYIWYFVSATTTNGMKLKSEDKVVEVKDSPLEHKGVWATHSWSNVVGNEGFYSGWERGNVVSLAFLQEGKGFQTLGAQLDYTYENPDYISAMAQWGPSTRENPVAFAFLAGATGHRSSDPSFSRVRQSRQFTPLLGGSVKFYPLGRVAVDATASVRLQSENASANRDANFIEEYLHHYEAGIRLYISPTLNLKAGYGRWRLGEYDNASVQVGLGATF